MATGSVTITDAQSVALTIQPLDSAGQPTTVIGGYRVPDITSITSGALVIGAVSAFPWTCTISAASPTTHGVFEISVTVVDNTGAGIPLSATGTVTVVSGTISSIVLVFGPPTP